MNRYQYNGLAIAVMIACYSGAASADLRSQCLAGVPHFQGEIINGEPSELPISIEADQAELTFPEEAIYVGQVQVQQGSRSLQADEARIRQQAKGQRIELNGAFAYQDPFIQARGLQAVVDLGSKVAELSQTDYHFVGRQGRGRAEQAHMNEQTRVLKNATYTACLPNDNAWQLDAAEMIQHIQEEYAELWHARFKVMGVPVFYTPYLQYPIGDRRRSGLLMPTHVGHSSRDGFSYGQPIYWHIAPHLDATLTPTYYTRRGWQLSPEFRYLTLWGEGKLAGEYLSRDRLNDWAEKKRSRHLFFWQHQANFLNHWRFGVDYTRVSDSRYFTDFDSDYGNSTDGYATQNMSLGYYQPNYHVVLSAKKFQTFDDAGVKPYRVLPKLDLNYYADNVVRHGQFRLFGQIAHFDNDSRDMPTAWRFHAEPSLNFPLANRFGSLNLEGKLYATHYVQKAGSAADAEAIRTRVTRVLPQFKLDLNTTLTATKPLFKGFNQVLEPRLQYLYRPYRDQQYIGSKRQAHVGLGYDSALLQQDYFSLFNDRRYSGLDRIASANQTSLGATTRFFDRQHGHEVFNLSAGQIYYFSPSKIDAISLNSTAKRSSSWALESNWKFHPKWNWRGSYQYDTRLNESSLANMSLQFQPKEEHLIQLNYRYASKNYINQNLSLNQYGQDIKQLGGVIGWPVNERLSLMTSYYQDLALKQMVEGQLGLAWHSCCWRATLYAARHLTTAPAGKSDTRQDFYYENRFGINLELHMGQGYQTGISRMLKRGIIPHSEVFNIN